MLHNQALSGVVQDAELVLPAGVYTMTGNVVVGTNATLRIAAGANITVAGGSKKRGWATTSPF